MKPINNPKPIKTIPNVKNINDAYNPVRFRIKADCAPRAKSSDYKIDRDAVERRRKIGDLEDAKAMGMTLAEYRLMMGIV